MVEDESRYSNPPGETLKELRTRLRLTQSELAEVLGTTERTIRRYENGELRFSIELWQIKLFIGLMHQAGMPIDSLPDRPK